MAFLVIMMPVLEQMELAQVLCCVLTWIWALNLFRYFDIDDQDSPDLTVNHTIDNYMQKAITW